jgi:ATP/maltotriose-dependent transcriptional regulator MalT
VRKTKNKQEIESIFRPRVTESIQNAMQKGTVYVAASADSGKTQAVRDCLNNHTGIVAWLSFCDNCNEPVQFWSEFCLSLLKAGASKHQVDELLSSGFPKNDKLMCAAVSMLGKLRLSGDDIPLDVKAEDNAYANSKTANNKSSRAEYVGNESSRAEYVGNVHVNSEPVGNEPAGYEPVGNEPAGTAPKDIEPVGNLRKDNDIVLVFDDFHVLENISVLTFMRQLVCNRPVNVCVLILSRISPLSDAGPKRIAKNGKEMISLFDRGHYALLQNSDLDFDFQEACQLMQHNGISISPFDIQQIVDTTEGWVWAIKHYVMALLVSQESENYHKTAREMVFAYLYEESAKRFTINTRKDILSLSLVARPSLEIADDLLSQCDAFKFRAKPWQSLGLMDYNSISKSYRMHSFLLEFLEGIQHLLSEEEKRAVFRCGADWSKRKGFSRRAFFFLAKLKDYDQMLDILLHLPIMLNRSSSKFYLDILDSLALPTSTADDPRFCLRLMKDVFSSRFLVSLERYEEAEYRTLEAINYWEQAKEALFVQEGASQNKALHKDMDFKAAVKTVQGDAPQDNTLHTSNNGAKVPISDKELSDAYHKQDTESSENAIDMELLINIMLFSLYNCMNYTRVHSCTFTHVYDFAAWTSKAREIANRCAIPITSSEQLNYPVMRSFVCFVGIGAKRDEIDEFASNIHKMALDNFAPLDGYYYGYDDLLESEIAFFRGDIAAARRFAAMAITKAASRKQYEIEASAIFYAVKAALVDGDYPAIEKLLEKTSKDVGKSSFLRGNLFCGYILAIFYSALNILPMVPSFLSQPSLYEDYDNNLIIRDNITRAQCLIAAKRFDDAYAVLQLPSFDTGDGRFLLCELVRRTFCAMARNGMGDAKGALDDFQSSYELTFNGELVMPYVENGQLTRSLVRLALASDSCTIPRKWLTDIDRRASSYIKKTAIVAADVRKKYNIQVDFNLSERERELLNDICQGLSREEIAATRYLSVNTVKTVLKSLYAKLGASSNIEVLRIALAHDMLSDFKQLLNNK